MKRSLPMSRRNARLCASGALAIAAMLGLSTTSVAQVQPPVWMPARVLAANSPSGRSGHALAYDVARQSAVLFGGWDGNTYLSDTWVWDGSAWVARSPAGFPSPRSGHAMAYDAARNRVVLFGGVNTNVLSDTWEWDGGSWVQRAPVTSPGAHHAHAMAYDAARQRVVLFGGRDGNNNFVADLWEWDGGNWSQRSPAASPSPRFASVMAYDVARQRVVLFGGMDSATSPLSDTWEWDGGNWVQRSPATVPDARWSHTMAYDALRRRVVLFGGVGANVLSDTWEWDGTDWIQRSLPPNPSARYDAAMVYDAARQRIVLFGGAPPMSGVPLADTWLFGELIPATAQPFGAACPAASGPALLTNSVPYLGNPVFRLEVLSARPFAPCLTGLATAPENLALGGGCTLYVKLPMIIAWVLVISSTGFGESPPLEIPADSALHGIALYAQAFVVDPNGPALGLAFSNGQRLLLGD